MVGSYQLGLWAIVCPFAKHVFILTKSRQILSSVVQQLYRGQSSWVKCHRAPREPAAEIANTISETCRGWEYVRQYLSQNVIAHEWCQEALSWEENIHNNKDCAILVVTSYLGHFLGSAVPYESQKRGMHVMWRLSVQWADFARQQISNIYYMADHLLTWSPEKRATNCLLHKECTWRVGHASLTRGPYDATLQEYLESSDFSLLTLKDEKGKHPRKTSARIHLPEIYVCIATQSF